MIHVCSAGQPAVGLLPAKMFGQGCSKDSGKQPSPNFIHPCPFPFSICFNLSHTKTTHSGASRSHLCDSLRPATRSLRVSESPSLRVLSRRSSRCGAGRWAARLSATEPPRPSRRPRGRRRSPPRPPRGAAPRARLEAGRPGARRGLGVPVRHRGGSFVWTCRKGKPRGGQRLLGVAGAQKRENGACPRETTSCWVAEVIPCGCVLPRNPKMGPTIGSNAQNNTNLESTNPQNETLKHGAVVCRLATSTIPNPKVEPETPNLPTPTTQISTGKRPGLQGCIHTTLQEERLLRLGREWHVGHVAVGQNPGKPW